MSRRGAVRRVAAAAVRRKRVQSVVVAIVVLLSSGTAVLALALLDASSAPFQRAFDRLTGAHAAAGFDAAAVDAGTVAATGSRSGVTGAAGPYDAVTAELSDGRAGRPAMTIVGRAEQQPAVDHLQLTAGQWLTGPGQIVLSRDLQGDGPAFRVGDRVTVGVPGSPALEVVGTAESATGTAGAWVWPGQTDVLHAAGAPRERQMLYRFAAAGTDDQLRTALASATAGLPEGAYAGAQTWLAVKLRTDEGLAPMVPFVVAFAVLGLVISVLIVADVVAGAVVAGFRTIGMLKALGFTPAQVVGAYAGQVLLVGVPAALAGVALGWLLSVPLLAATNEAYSVAGATAAPLRAGALVLVAVPMVIVLAAIVPAMRAGRLPAVEALTVGRAPRTGRGHRVRRMLAATRLPVPVAFGSASPIARPGRAAVTVVAILLGTATVVLATGLASSLTAVRAGFDRVEAVPVTVPLPGQGGPGPAGAGPGEPAGAGPGGPPGGEPADPAAVRAAIDRQAGTAHVAGMGRTHVTVAGHGRDIEAHVYHDEASWTGYPMLDGRWYAAPGEAVASSRLLRLTGLRVGDTVTAGVSGTQHRLRIVGEVFSNGDGGTLITGAASLPGTRPELFEIGVTPGTDLRGYADKLTTALGNPRAAAQLTSQTQENETVALMIGLISLLTTGLAAVAALGVFHSVVLTTRERVHEIGVLKAIGMTPQQVRVMVVTSTVVLGMAGGALAVPVGQLLHHRVLVLMGEAAGTGLPESVFAVYDPVRLLALGVAGVVLAVAGALIPAGWAARTRPATALRSE